MKIKFIKGKAHKDHTLRCIREDGTETWTPLLRRHFGAEHDLIHYVVETELGFSRGFFGLLSEGYEIDDFEKVRPERPEALIPKNLPPEAKYSEILVGLLQTELWQNQDDNEEFLKTLDAVCSMRDIPVPKELSLDKLQQIRTKAVQTLKDWKALADGSVMEFDFSAP